MEKIQTSRKNFCGLKCPYLDRKRDWCKKFEYTVPKKNLKTYWRCEACKKEAA